MAPEGDGHAQLRGGEQAKFVMRIEAVASPARTGEGKGGYWEDSAGCQWFAGI